MFNLCIALEVLSRVEMRNTGNNIKHVNVAEPKSWRVFEYSCEIWFVSCFLPTNMAKKQAFTSKLTQYRYTFV